MWFGFSSHFSGSKVGKASSSVPEKDDKLRSPNIDRNAEFVVGWCGKAYLFGLFVVEIWGQFLHPLIFGNGLPFFPLMMISIYCALGMTYSWIWQLRYIAKSRWLHAAYSLLIPTHITYTFTRFLLYFEGVSQRAIYSNRSNLIFFVYFVELKSCQLLLRYLSQSADNMEWGLSAFVLDLMTSNWIQIWILCIWNIYGEIEQMFLDWLNVLTIWSHWSIDPRPTDCIQAPWPVWALWTFQTIPISGIKRP